VIDEVHLFRNEGKKALIRLATTGLGRGYKCIFISQRPAMIDNTLLTQSTKHILFAIGLNDASYLKSNGFPSEEIMNRTGQEKYIFVEFDQKIVKGGFTII
jgi:predicted YcjX-like family ATPase